MTTVITNTVATANRPSPSTPASVARMVRIEIRLLLREPMVAISLVALPLTMVLVLAGVFGQTPDPEFAGIAPSQHYVVGYLGVVLASLGLTVLPVHVASERELGVRRRYRAAGVGAGTLFGRDLVLGTLLGVMSGVIVVAAGALVYGVRAPARPVELAIWFVIGLASFVTIGIALGSLMPSARAAAAFGNLVFVPMFLLGGGGPPRSVQTPAMRAISDMLPLSHVIGGLRHGWLGRTDDPRQMWWPALVSTLLLLATWNRERRQQL